MGANSYTEALKVLVIEYDHGPHAHGVHGIASTLKEAFEKVRAATSVQWDEPAQAVMGGAWLIRGTWHDGFREGPQFVLYRVTEHSVPSGPNNYADLMFARLAPTLAYVDGTAVGYGEDEIDRLRRDLKRLGGPSGGNKNAEAKLAAAGVYAGLHGLRGLYEASEFWQEQPYGTRLYYGSGIGQYLHRGVLYAALQVLDGESPPPATEGGK